MAKGKVRKTRVVRKVKESLRLDGLSFEKLDFFLKNMYSSFLSVFLGTSHYTVCLHFTSKPCNGTLGSKESGERQCPVGMRDCASSGEGQTHAKILTFKEDGVGK